LRAEYGVFFKGLALKAQSTGNLSLQSGRLLLIAAKSRQFLVDVRYLP
jgi:hypothetical protein